MRNPTGAYNNNSCRATASNYIVTVSHLLFVFFLVLVGPSSNFTSRLELGSNFTEALNVGSTHSKQHPF